MPPTNRRGFLHLAGRYLGGLGLASGLASLLAGCQGLETVADLGTSIGTATGAISPEDAESISKSARAVARSFKEITPQQEYYIGRTVGALVLSKYKPYANRAANRYVNLLGQTLACASNLPETFGGYHFLIQDSDEINALAAPGGLIFITRGMLQCCRNETAAAAVLAHEIGHVELKHGLQAIKTARVTAALTTIGVEGSKQLGGQELADLTRTFEDSINDITQTLVNSGYSRAFENQADTAAVRILQQVGYDPNGLIDMLKVMQTRLDPGRRDFAATHPPPSSRIAALEASLGKYTPPKIPVTRQKRFVGALGSL
jgi:predicted Zn-dependent protease